MSYSLQEAKAERAYDISAASQGVDAPEKLRKLAVIINKEGNEPLAHQLYMKANRIENMYDEYNNN